MSLKNVSPLLISLTALALIACGGNNGDDNNASDNNSTTTPANNTTTTPPNNTTTTTPPNNTTSASNAPESYESDYQLIFTRMEFVNFESKSAATYKLLNRLIKANLDPALETPIIVLIDYKDIDAEAGTLKLRSGAGLKTSTEGEYEWDPETSKTYADSTLDAQSGETAGLLSDFVFVATLDNGEKVDIPINDLQFSGTLQQAEDAGEVMIKEGTIKGYITVEQARDAKIEVTKGNPPIQLSALLKEEDVNFDSDEDGTNDSWTLEAEFDAQPTIID